MKRWLLAIVGLIGILVVVVGCTGAPEKQLTAEEFYRGNTVTVSAGSAPGGGYDLQTRVIAPYWAKELGVKSLIVTNEAGGGGWKHMNYIYSGAKKDGTEVGLMQFGKAVNNQVFGLGEPAAFKSIAEFNLIGGTTSTADRLVVVVNPGSPFNSLKDMIGAKGLTGGASSLFSAAHRSEAIVKYCLGLPDFQTILGFESTSDIVLSVFRGETSFCAYDYPTLKPNIQGGNIKPVGGGGYERLPQFPDLPAMGEVALPGTTKWIDYYNLLSISRMMGAPPGIPEDRLEFLRQTFQKAATSPGYLAEAEKREMEGFVLFGQELQDSINRVVNLTPDQINEIKTGYMSYVK